MSRPSPCHKTQCIVLAPRESAEDTRLCAALDERGWDATCVHEPLDGMLETARIEHDQKSRAGWGLQRTEQVALVITHPAQWDSLDELSGAMKRYFPSVPVLWFDGSNLVPFGDEGRAAAAPDQADGQAECDTDEREDGREDANEEPSDGQQQHMEHEEAPDGSVVTRDELDMLLEVAADSESNS